MKITGYQVDWKDGFESDVIENCCNEVGGRKLMYYHEVGGWVDAKLMMFSSESLSGDERDKIWETGDLGIADKVFEGTLDEILVQLRENLTDHAEGPAANVHSDDILDTLEGFLDTCPALEGKGIEFDDRMAGESDTVRTMRIVIGGVQHLVIVKVGG